MEHWRKVLIFGWFAAMVVSIGLFFVPWRFVIPGYEFPYHGRPALLAGCLALAAGVFATWRGWRGQWHHRPWLVVCLLLAIQIGFQVAFIRGPDVVTAKGSTAGPWGESPIQFGVDVPAKWGVYASAIAAGIGFLTAAATGLHIARHRRTDQ